MEDSTLLPTSTLIPIDITFGISVTYTKHDILHLMPARHELDRLVAAFFNVMDSIRCKSYLPEVSIPKLTSAVTLHDPTFQQQVFYGSIELETREPVTNASISISNFG